MADMYGAVRSNDFKVKDVGKFKEWFSKYHFGNEIELFEIESEAGILAFGGYEQYPVAVPRIWDEAEQAFVRADMTQFVNELSGHLIEGECFCVVAGGNEKLRYVAFSVLYVNSEREWDVADISSDSPESIKALFALFAS